MQAFFDSERGKMTEENKSGWKDGKFAFDLRAKIPDPEGEEEFLQDFPGFERLVPLRSGAAFPLPVTADRWSA
jgi:hypothetical protein